MAEAAKKAKPFKKPTPTRADYEKYQKHTEDLMRDEALDYVDTIRAGALRRTDKARDKALDAVKKDPSRKGEFFGSDGFMNKERAKYFGNSDEDRKNGLNHNTAIGQEFSKEAIAKRKGEVDKLKAVDEERMRAAGLKRGGKVKAKASRSKAKTKGGGIESRGNGCCSRTKKCKMR